MTDAFLCDGCGEFVTGDRSGSVHDHENNAVASLTHDLCEGCHDELTNALDNQSLSESLEQFGGGA